MSQEPKLPVGELVEKFEGMRHTQDNLLALANECGITYHELHELLSKEGCNMRGIPKYRRCQPQPTEQAEARPSATEQGYQETIRKQLAELRELRETVAQLECERNAAQADVEEIRGRYAMLEEQSMLQIAEINDLKKMLAEERAAAIADAKANAAPMVNMAANPPDEDLRDAIVQLFLRAFRR